jgi:hypothetical protein
MRQGKWIGSLLLAALLAGQAAAGEFTATFRGGISTLHVDGDRLSTGDAVSEALMSVGVNFAYRWDTGPLVEFGLSQSFDPVPILGWNDVSHISLAAGWQFEMNRWRVTPKVGLTHSSLESQQEDFFEGDEPVDEIKEVVPFLDFSAEYRLWDRIGLGFYLRRNFEDFGSTTMYGLSWGYTFK